MKYFFYSIKSKIDDEIVYIGSTTNYKRRISEHMGRCKNENDDAYNKPLYKYIREQGGIDNFEFEIIEEVECDNKNESLAIENKYIEQYNCKCNKRKPGAFLDAGSRKEYMKQYQEANREKLNEYMKEYYARKKAEKVQNITINNSSNISININ